MGRTVTFSIEICIPMLRSTVINKRQVCSKLMVLSFSVSTSVELNC